MRKYSNPSWKYADNGISNQILIYCDVGRKRVMLVDSHLNKFLFARIEKRKEGTYTGEYKAIIFALNYIHKTYKDRDIVLLTDAKSESDALNGNYAHRNPLMKYIFQRANESLVKARIYNIVNIIWLPRSINEAGLFLERFNYNRTTHFAKNNIEQLDYETLEPIPIAVGDNSP